MAKINVKAFPEVAAADLARLGERKKGLNEVQQFLSRFGYIQSGIFKSGELDTPTSDAYESIKNATDYQQQENSIVRHAIR